jgi:catechol 2,3-dioxygenase-like lactoylglutathione lyase family enzyme
VANVLAKLGFESRADLRAWAGIRRDSNLARQETNMQADLLIGPVGQIARSVKDIAAARDWYGDVLGLKHLYSFGNLAFFDCGGVRLFLSEGEGTASESILYFRVPDVRTAHQALAGRGVAFTHAPHMIHRHPDGVEEWMAFFTDNEARPLAIMSQTPPSQG